MVFILRSGFSIPYRKLARVGFETIYIDGELKTDLLVKPTDAHQFLDPTSSYPYLCKKGIPYSQALRLERRYNEKMIRSQILRARKHLRNDLLEEREREREREKSHKCLSKN